MRHRRILETAVVFLTTTDRLDVFLKYFIR